MNYKEIIKLRWPDKIYIHAPDDTYENIVWNALDQTTNPSKAELDAAITEELARLQTVNPIDPIVVTGDCTGTGAPNLNLIFNTVNSNVGTFGSGTEIPVLVINAKGLITSASNVTLTSSAKNYFSGYNTATTALANATTKTPIPMNVEVRKDTGTFTHTAASSQVTVLAAGWYKIEAQGCFQASTGSSKGVMQLYKNGTAITGAATGFSHASSNYQTNVTILFHLQCAANDAIDFRAWFTAGGFTLVANSCRLLMETM